MEYIKPLNDDAYPERLGAYINANPSLGIPGSTVPGEALQHTMTEIINAITAAGLTPDDADLTQLTQAIKQLGTPIGSVLAYPIDDVPVHCLECNGAIISRETYPELFAVIGETYGTGDGVTTFKLPDLRGEFLRGWDNGRGVNSGRIIGSSEESSYVPRYAWVGTNSAYIGADIINNDGIKALNNPSRYYVKPASYTLTENNTGQATRPRNVAMMYCIVYE